MDINEVYLKFLEKVNKNFTNDNISVDKTRFVFIFNESQNKFVEWILEKRNEDDIRDIQKLLVYDKDLSFKDKTINQYNFDLPSNFFSFSNLQVFANKGNCKNKRLEVFEVKTENKFTLLEDENNKPSFSARETFYTLGSDCVNIFYEDFEIHKAFLTYYRYPKKIDIEGYIRLDNTASISIDAEFDEKIVDRIISIAAKEFNRNSENFQKIQFDKDNIISKA